MKKSVLTDLGIVPRESLVPGSPEWCRRTLDLARSRKERLEMLRRQYEETLKELVDHDAWEVYPPDKPYGDFDEMLRCELG